jgi:hypothetical protein
MKKLLLEDDGRAYWGGQDLGVTLGEWRIFAKLARKPGGYFSYRDIYDSLRGTPGFFAGDGERGVNSNVRSAIKRMRRKLRALDPTLGRNDVIVNYLAYGYGLQRDVLDTAQCCPSCGQLVIVRETVVAAPTPAPAPIPQLVPDYKAEVVS